MKSGTHRGGGRLRRTALALLLVMLVVGSGVMPVGAASSAPKFLGPVTSKAEGPNVTLGRDGGFTVPLPNGKDLWIFADTPRFEFTQGKWRFRGFIPGSTAGLMPFTPGRTPTRTQRLAEIKVGHRPATVPKPAKFIPSPTNVYMPNGSGKKCNQANGQSSTNPVRWPAGGALMPDKTNVLIAYVDVCLVNSYFYTGEGWGYALYNWKTNRFTQPPYDVFKPKKDGSELRRDHYFSSPIITGNKVNFFTWGCCGASGGVFRTTVDISKLKNPASYVLERIQNVPATYELSVVNKSKTHNRYTMYTLTGTKGQYSLYTASSVAGPWTKKGAGSLPRCNTSPYPCHSIILHPELSPTGRMVVSYHLAGYGPADASKHPYPKEPLRHVVMSSVKCC
jgi:hypothetical protein